MNEEKTEATTTTVQNAVQQMFGESRPKLAHEPNPPWRSKVCAARRRLRTAHRRWTKAGGELSLKAWLNKR